MPLVPIHPFPERLLVFGPPDCGKSENWISIARLFYQTKTPGRFFVIDPDLTGSILIEPELLSTNGGNVFLFQPTNWTEWLTVRDTILSLTPTSSDWIVFDPITQVWTEVQDEFARRVYGKDIGSFMLSTAEASGNKGPATQGLNWQAINAAYSAVIQPLVTKTPAHVYASARGKKLNEEYAKKEDRLTFADVPLAVAGQGDLSYQFLSVLMVSQRVRGNWALTTVKEKRKGRPVLKDKTVGASFALTYLMQTAGWEVK